MGGAVDYITKCQNLKSIELSNVWWNFLDRVLGERLKAHIENIEEIIISDPAESNMAYDAIMSMLSGGKVKRLRLDNVFWMDSGLSTMYFEEFLLCFEHFEKLPHLRVLEMGGDVLPRKPNSLSPGGHTKM